MDHSPSLFISRDQEVLSAGVTNETYADFPLDPRKLLPDGDVKQVEQRTTRQVLT